MAKRPHLLIFNPDSWRGDVQGYLGDRAAVTPVLDGLVENDAVGFGSAFCQNPVCTPSRCSFMTGWYTHVRGHRTMYHMLRPDEPMLLKTLKDSGYFVWWGGKNDLVPGQNGYEPFCDVKYQPPTEPRQKGATSPEENWRGDGPEDDRFYSFYRGKLDTEGGEVYRDRDWANVMGAIELIDNYDGEKPLCIYLPLSFPHPAYAVENPWYDMIDRGAIPKRTPAPESWEKKPSLLEGIHRRQGLSGWSEERWTELRATYYGMCARVDHQFGLVLEALKRAGIYDDTAAFLFSDHGDFTGDYGLVEKTQNTFEDCLTQVPLVIKPPKDRAVMPRATDALVELIDVPATIEDLCGITPEHTHMGRSLLPLIAGETDEHRDAVFCEGGRLHGEIHCMELDSTSAQEPSGLYWPRVALQSSEGPEHTKAVMCRTADYKYVRRLYESDELYDLNDDPMEVKNRIDDPSLSTVLADMKDRLLTFFQETGDVVPHDSDRRS